MTVLAACRRSTVPVDPTYRNGVWAVTPYLGLVGEGRRPRKTLFVVTHVPTGNTCAPNLEPLRHDYAVNLCRALGAEFPDFMADASLRAQPPKGLQAMEWRIRELHAQRLSAQRSFRKGRP